MVSIFVQRDNNGLSDGFDSRDFPAPKLQLELEPDLQLDRSARVLLNPKLDDERGDPFPDRKEVMDLGVAGGTDRVGWGLNRELATEYFQWVFTI
jgi:hypothetical protein